MNEAIKKIVLIMVCLAVPGYIMAGVHYVAIDLPIQQDSFHAPVNMR